MGNEFIKNLYSFIKETVREVPAITPELAKEIGDKLNVNWDEVSLEELAMGIEIEKEHADTVGIDLEKFAQIALDHLKELPDYYTRLKQMEAQGKDGVQAVEPVQNALEQEVQSAQQSTEGEPDRGHPETLEGGLAPQQEILVTGSPMGEAMDKNLMPAMGDTCDYCGKAGCTVTDSMGDYCSEECMRKKNAEMGYKNEAISREDDVYWILDDYDAWRGKQNMPESPESMKAYLDTIKYPEMKEKEKEVVFNAYMKHFKKHESVQEDWSSSAYPNASAPSSAPAAPAAPAGKDTLKIIAASVSDKAVADDIARKNAKSVVLQDKDNPKKWMVVMKESIFEDFKESNFNGKTIEDLKKEAYDYFGKMNISPVAEDIAEYVATEIEGNIDRTLSKEEFAKLAEELGLDLEESIDWDWNLHQDILERAKVEEISGSMEDFTGDFYDISKEGQTKQGEPMYSFDRPSMSFWNGFANALKNAGYDRDKIFLILGSTYIRHYFDSIEDKQEKVGFQYGKEFLSSHKKQIDSMIAKEGASESVQEATPPGEEYVVKGLKKAKGVDNPYAVAWWLRKKGAHFRKGRNAGKTMKSVESKTPEQIKELAEKLMIVSFLNKKGGLTEKQQEFVKETLAIKLSASERALVEKEFVKMRTESEATVRKG
jgi:hypothetical protein